MMLSTVNTVEFSESASAARLKLTPAAHMSAPKRACRADAMSPVATNDQSMTVTIAIVRRSVVLAAEHERATASAFASSAAAMIMRRRRGATEQSSRTGQRRSSGVPS